MRNEIFSNYNNFIKTNSFENDTYPTFEELIKEYKFLTDSNNKDRFREDYKDSILKILDFVLTKKPNILVFPEYSIPLDVFNAIKERNFPEDCIVIAGTRIEDRYNVCPIIISEKPGRNIIFDYYKNALSPFERALGLVKNEGFGYFKFVNEKWVNFCVRICYDIFRNDDRLFDKLDILLVPSYNSANIFVNTIRNKSCDFKLVSAYSNTININNISSAIFVPTRQGSYASMQGLTQFHSDYYPVGFTLTTDEIFSFEPDEELSLIEKEINNFNFRIKFLEYDSMQLDIRRGRISRKERKERDVD